MAKYEFIIVEEENNNDNIGTLETNGNDMAKQIADHLAKNPHTDEIEVPSPNEINNYRNGTSTKIEVDSSNVTDAEKKIKKLQDTYKTDLNMGNTKIVLNTDETSGLRENKIDYKKQKLNEMRLEKLKNNISYELPKKDFKKYLDWK